MKTFIAFLTIFVFTTPAVSQKVDSTTLTKVGQPVPNFTVTTLDGKSLTLSELRGKVVLIDFFATWCEPCMNEMPKIEEKIWQGLKSDKLVVLAIGREHTTDELVKFNKDKKFTFSIAPDPKREIYRLFATQFIPRNYVIDKEGRIVFQSMGYASEDFDKMVEIIRKQL